MDVAPTAMANTCDVSSIKPSKVMQWRCRSESEGMYSVQGQRSCSEPRTVECNLIVRWAVWEELYVGVASHWQISREISHG